MKFYLAKVSYYDQINEDLKQDCLVIAGTSMPDAIKSIEDYYGDDLEDVFIEIINREYPFVILPGEKIYNTIRNEGVI